MTLGEKLQDLRRKQGISQDALAEQLEVSRQAVSKWERDEAMPEIDKIIKLSRIFGVSTDYLLTEDGPAPAPASSYTRTPPVEDRIVLFFRRHAYKIGYVLTGLGAFICIMSITLCLLWPLIAGNFLTAGVDSFYQSFGGSFDIQVEGIPEDVVDEIWGQMPAAGGIFDDFGNSASQATTSMVNAQSLIFLINLIPGILLMVLGLFLVKKGKRWAQSANP